MVDPPSCVTIPQLLPWHRIDTLAQAPEYSTHANNTTIRKFIFSNPYRREYILLRHC
jgi:hypothetical protein